ncbi:MAG: hypothetical protein ACOC56_05075, partial [Atribacterota bacterium]
LLTVLTVVTSLYIILHGIAYLLNPNLIDLFITVLSSIILFYLFEKQINIITKIYKVLKQK